MPVETRIIDGVSLAYRITGDAGGRPIVLIHGLTANMVDWRFTVKVLGAAGWCVLTPDLPGHGDSAAPDDPEVYAMANVADRVHALAKALGFAPAVIAGHSMGGAVAEEYVARHGADVTALVLVDSAGGSPRPYKRTAEMDAFAEEERALAFAEGMGAVWDLHQARGTWLSAKGLSPQVQTFLKARFCRCSPQGYVHGDRKMNGRRNTIDGLKCFAKPALVVVGENEHGLMKGTSEELAAALPRARHVVIPGAGHSPQHEAIPAFNAALLGFLDGLPRVIF